MIFGMFHSILKISITNFFRKDDMADSLKIIYKSYNDVEVRIDDINETVWLNKNEIAKLFDIDRSGVSRHINNIFKTQELQEIGNVQKMHIPNSDKPVDFFNLDIILAVGYRINSSKAIAFRRWATRILKEYLIKGYALNQKIITKQKEKLLLLEQMVAILNRSLENQIETVEQAQNVGKILQQFAKGLNMLDDFDHKRLDSKGKNKTEAIQIPIDEFLLVIDKMKGDFASDVFAQPKDESFSSSVNQIYQTFDGKELYPSLEEKAAMLLYLIVKNHSFLDGNKRIGASCFLYFMDKNGLLYDKFGRVIIDNATLFALTLLIAESKADEMETIKKVIISILNRNT